MKRVHSHFAKGALFENLIILELMKSRFNQNYYIEFNYWRDQVGSEVDCVFELAQMLVAVEIKSGQTINSDFFKHVNYLLKLAGEEGIGFLIYGGDERRQQQRIEVLPWRQCTDLFEMVKK